MEWNDQLTDDALRQSAASLEQSYPQELPPPREIWNAIEAKRKRRKVVRMQQLWRVAASVILLATFITLWVVSRKGSDQVLIHKTIAPAPLQADETEAMQYIARQCAGNNIVCQSAVFKELQVELNSAESELSTINQQIKLFGDDEQLLRARIRIENHQARIVKAMLQIL
jgi:septal ring factor EnvC (AmiA/AmiB activator)